MSLHVLALAAGYPNLLSDIATSLGFSFDLYARVDDGIQGLPVDIAAIIASGLKKPLGEILAAVPYTAPPGPASRKVRPALTVFPIDPTQPLALQLPTRRAIQLAPVSAPLVVGYGGRGPRG